MVKDKILKIFHEYSRKKAGYIPLEDREELAEEIVTSIVGPPVVYPFTVWSPDTYCYYWHNGGWQFSQPFDTKEDAEKCEDIVYTEKMLRCMPR